MTPKIKILSGIILLLLLAIFFSLRPASKNNSGSAQAVFALTPEDSQAIDKFVFGPVVLRKTQDAAWTVNNKLPADPLLIERLFMVMQHLDIRRSVAENQQSALLQQLQQKGTRVEVYAGEEIKKSYLALSQENETFLVAFKEGKVSGEPFSVYVPGYDVDLNMMYSLGENGWRDHTLMQTTWRSLKKLEVSYPQSQEQSFSIAFDSSFYKVSGVKRLDSLMLYNYIEAYNGLRARSFVEDERLRDSLKQVSPLAVINLQDMVSARDNLLRIYKIPRGWYGIAGKSDQLVLFEERYITRFLVRKKDFEK